MNGFSSIPPSAFEDYSDPDVERMTIIDKTTTTAMNKSEYKDLVNAELNRMIELIEAKNADYAPGDDPFSNFRSSEDWGVEPLVGLCIRMDDKRQRIRAYVEKGDLEVKDEGVIDAFRDLIGYSCLAIGMLVEDRRRRAQVARDIMERRKPCTEE